MKIPSPVHPPRRLRAIAAEFVGKAIKFKKFVNNISIHIWFDNIKYLLNSFYKVRKKSLTMDQFYIKFQKKIRKEGIPLANHPDAVASLRHSAPDRRMYGEGNNVKSNRFTFKSNLKSSRFLNNSASFASSVV